MAIVLETVGVSFPPLYNHNKVILIHAVRIPPPTSSYSRNRHRGKVTAEKRCIAGAMPGGTCVDLSIENQEPLGFYFWNLRSEAALRLGYDYIRRAPAFDPAIIGLYPQTTDGSGRMLMALLNFPNREA